ncbi:MAG: Rpn family recombination-promoting nuclease/putative transposase [Gammaproteobacteria bacterium]|nr:Rpn family recombination-promoting nuclease/putative transposase [Gammaproteobacteria bacterium]
MIRARTDEGAKLVFMAAVVGDLLRAVLPEVAAALDLDAIKPLPTEYISYDRSKRVGDAVFRVPVRPAYRRGMGRLDLILMAEFQNRGDSDMLARVVEYRAWMLEHYRHQGVIGSGEHPPVLALVVNTGDAPWRGETGMEPLSGLSEPLAALLAPYQPQAYIAVETGSKARVSAWPEHNRASAVVRLAKCATPEALRDRLAAEWMRFGDAADAQFRRGLLAWAEERLLGLGESDLSLPLFEELEGQKEKQMSYLLEDRVAEWKAEWAAEGQRLLLKQLLETRFGAESAAQLMEALSGTEGVTLSEAADLIVTCESAEEFSASLNGGR